MNMEELKFEKLSDVAEVAELADGDYVMAVKDGEIVKISKDEVGGKRKRELVYEWNFSADDNVHVIMENVNDIDWLVKPNRKVGFEIEAEVYYCSYDEDDNVIVHEDKVLHGSVNDTCYAGYFNGLAGQPHLIDMCGSDFFVYGYEVYDESGWINCIGLAFELIDRYHYDIDYDSLLEVEEGGRICVYEDNSNPIKSVRIYKVSI